MKYTLHILSLALIGLLSSQTGSALENPASTEFETKALEADFEKNMGVIKALHRNSKPNIKEIEQAYEKLDKLRKRIEDIEATQAKELKKTVSKFEKELANLEQKIK